MRAPAVERAQQVVDLLARATTAARSRARAPRRTGRRARRPPAGGRSLRSSRGSRGCRGRGERDPVFHEAELRPAASATRPVRPSRAGSSANRPPTSASKPGGYVQSSSGNATTSAARCPSATFRARERPGSERRWSTSSPLSAQQRLEPVVAVLVDDENPEAGVRLSAKRVEQPGELVRPADRRDDEVERRKRPRHGP